MPWKTCEVVDEPAHFINADLDLYSRSDLRPLVTALSRRICVLHMGRDGRTYCAHLELTAPPKSADEAIRRFCALIRRLPGPAREIWNAARVRDFNIGVEAGTRPFSYEFALRAETVEAAAALKARIVFTLYAPERVS